MFHVYVLRSGVTGRLYTGSTADIEDRLCRHNAGECKATRHGIPWTLVYTEAFLTRAEAVRRERYFKTGRGREELERSIAGSSRGSASFG
jgi:putative endonuclease